MSSQGAALICVFKYVCFGCNSLDLSYYVTGVEIQHCYDVTQLNDY